HLYGIVIPEMGERQEIAALPYRHQCGGDEMRTQLPQVILKQNAPNSHKWGRERVFVIAVMLIASFVIFVGFARTYYLNAFFARRSLTPTVHLHAFLFSAWFVLIFVQMTLLSNRRIDLHRRSGYIGALLALSIVIVGMIVTIHAAKYGTLAKPPGLPIANFLVVPFFDDIVFATLAGAGLY